MLPDDKSRFVPHGNFESCGLLAAVKARITWEGDMWLLISFVCATNTIIFTVMQLISGVWFSFIIKGKKCTLN